MEETYRAKLTGSPHPHLKPDNDVPNEVHAPLNAASGSSGPIPIQRSDIYVHPYPTPATSGPPVRPSQGEGAGFLSWKSQAPHPLIWVCMIISLGTLLFTVPKGSLPTLTGRHKALRTQERLVQEKLALLTQLATFLPPPLAHLISPVDPANPISSGVMALNDRRQLELVRSGTGLKFWNTNLGTHLGVGADGDRWWSIEDLGQGASVVKSRGDGTEREVWVLQMGEHDGAHTPTLNALTHSLLLRDRLLAELAEARTTPSPTSAPTMRYLPEPTETDNNQERDLARREQAERLDEQKKRQREREREVEEREREVARREKWVVEEMRKLSDKVHSQATELTLEDRITERLKAYQRQLAHLGDDTEETDLNKGKKFGDL
ncbi:hypothetical protein BCR39DRAFT_592642 [Naematelia encephala]|uniref:Uncharacterized protein n=1 Tax=Naematelia encephala TaxID=71784 RepID=A0A1Y2BGZ8_9TREE|nr:hypothetical protein BCR39DRAFT_592642 [Naematelia encephala]